MTQAPQPNVYLLRLHPEHLANKGRQRKALKTKTEGDIESGNSAPVTMRTAVTATSVHESRIKPAVSELSAGFTIDTYKPQQSV